MISKPLITVAFFILATGLAHAGEVADIPKFDDQTERIWKAHCVVPQTDDIKVLRAFLEYQIDQWLEMNGHLKGEKDWERFHNAKNRATFAAADRIIALLKTESGKEPPVPSSSGEYYGWNDTDDLRFALRKKISAFGWAYRHDPDWSDNFQEFIVEMKKNPANKYIVKLAEANWFGIPFNAAVFFNDYSFEQRLLRYQYNFEQLKVYCAENADDPCLKFAIDHWRAIHTQAAEVLEGSDQIKKGTLAKPALEFYRVLYQKYPDAPEAEGWLRNINSDLVKYDILSASDPTAAFQEAVTELKKSLENEINGESWLKVGDFIQIAEELESRNQSLVLLLTTVRPLFAASENEKIRDHVLGFDIRLKQLALEGKPFEFEAILLDGSKIDLKDYRGKVVILNYWATWCGPCIGETPQLKRFHENWKDRGVELIGFSVDEDLDARKKYVEKEKLPWPNASEKLSLEQKLPDSRKKYGIDAYPTTILIDQTGKVVRAGNGLYSVLGQVAKLITAGEEK